MRVAHLSGVSAIVIMLGHIALAVVPGVSGLVTGLVLVVVGSGGLKASATSAGPILTGVLQTKIGFHYGFGLAAVGMAIGLTQYSFGCKQLSDTARLVPDPLGPVNAAMPTGQYSSSSCSC